MSFEESLPSYAEAMRMDQTPIHILNEEATFITFKEPSPSSLIKSIISRRESDAQHDVYTGVKRRKKNKLVKFLEDILTGERCNIKSLSRTNTNESPSSNPATIPFSRFTKT